MAGCAMAVLLTLCTQEPQALGCSCGGVLYQYGKSEF